MLIFSTSPSPTNFQNLLVIETCIAVFDAVHITPHPSLSCGILKILLPRSREQMGRVYALTIVAGVTNFVAWWNRSNKRFINQVGYSSHPCLDVEVVTANHTVTARFDAQPGPTAVVIFWADFIQNPKS